MIVRLADEQDAPGLIELARKVEDWFGPMAGDPGFRAALDRHIGRGTALVAVNASMRGDLAHGELADRRIFLIDGIYRGSACALT